jgi:hypothetical protein
MANFLKPPGIDPKGYDAKLNKQTIGVAHYATVGLWGGGPSGEALKVALNDPSVATVAEQPRKGDLRIFRLTGSKAGSAMLEGKTSSGAVWAFMQIEIGGGAVPAGAKQIIVDLASQTLEAVEAGKRVFFFDCVTGDSTHPTDKGTFRVLRKHHPHTSSTYHVRMDYAMFFTTDGKAVHQYHGMVPLSVVRTLKSKVSDYMGSHGCVRLTEENARALYEWTPVGTQVRVK